MKRLLGIVAIVAACATLTGCTPTVRGMVGVRLDGDGSIHGVFEACEESVFGATLMNGYVEGQKWQTIYDWDFEPGRDVDDINVFPLSTPADDQALELHAWAGDNRLEEVRFTIAEVRSLLPGEILFVSPDSYSANVIGSQEQFELAACADD